MDTQHHEVSVALNSLLIQKIFDKPAFDAESFDNLGFTFTFTMKSYEDEVYTYDVNVYKSGIVLCSFNCSFGTDEKDNLVDIEQRSEFRFKDEDNV